MNVTEEQSQRGLLVQLELQEAVDRMRGEGMDFQSIMAGIGSLAFEVVKAEHSAASASAWFFGMAKTAANFAAADLKN